jgi:cell fate regulator YaaT (PSP1 superfamily)
MEPMDDCLVGIRLRDTAQADDYRVAGDLELHVGDLVLVETSAESTIGEVRRPRREIPEAKKDRLYRRVLRLATEAEARAYRERRRREELAIETAQQVARGRGLALKVVDVEMHPVARRATVYFSAEERIDFRDLVRDLARELRSRVEMRQIGARDTTRLLDGIGPCGRQLCCSSHLR